MDNTVPKAFIFMKVGWHGGESLDRILNRKKIELKEEGMIFWGYGGTVLNPQTQVQPFVKRWIKESKELDYIEVLMQPIESDSKTGSPAGTAKLFAANDKECWKPIPDGINTGSKHALVLDEIKECDLKLDLGKYEVGWGPSKKKKKNATEYLKGRTDKGVLVKAPRSRRKKGDRVSIKYRARLICPYAVFLCPPW